MPLYEYRCTECGESVEVLQRVGEPPVSECPRCGGSMTKLLSAPALQFRGSGWYLTDYARKGNGSAGDGASKGEPAGKGEDAGKPVPSAASSTSAEGQAAAASGS